MHFGPSSLSDIRVGIESQGNLESGFLSDFVWSLSQNLHE